MHFAPETFFYSFFDKNPNIEYFPGDLCPERYNPRLNGKKQVARTDLTDLQYEDSFFDLIICNHVLEHIPDDIKAMKELFRVMKPSGLGIFMVPLNYHPKPKGFDDYTTYEDFIITSEEGRREAFGQKDHVRVYGKDFKDRLISVGFHYNEFNYLTRLKPDELFKYGFANSYDVVSYCTKNK